MRAKDDQVMRWGREWVRTGPWRGDQRVAYLTPVPEAPAPSGDFVRRCLERPRFAEKLGQRAQSFVARQQGATETTLKLLTKLASPDEAAPTRRAA